jgi:hypothetical protein
MRFQKCFQTTFFPVTHFFQKIFEKKTGIDEKNPITFRNSTPVPPDNDQTSKNGKVFLTKFTSNFRTDTSDVW